MTPPLSIRIQAEDYDAASDHVRVDAMGEGGAYLGWVNDTEWVRFDRVEFGPEGRTVFRARVASADHGGIIEVRFDSPQGAIVTTCHVAGGRRWEDWEVATSPLGDGVSGLHDVYLVFRGVGTYVANVDWIEFGH